MKGLLIPESQEEVKDEKDLNEPISGDIMTERGRTQSGQWRRKRSDAGKKRKKKKGLLDWILDY